MLLLPLLLLLPGDLLAALLLAWIHKHPGNLALAVEKAVAGLQAVLAATVAAVSPAAAAVVQHANADMCPAAAAALAAAFKAKELRVIQSQQQLVDPSVKILAEKLLL
jgi:pyridoxine kinase